MDYGLLFRSLGPEVILTVTALVILLVDLKVLKDTPRIYRCMVSGGLLAVGCLGAMIHLQFFIEPATFSEGMLVQNSLNLLVKKCILFVSLITGLLAMEVRFTRDVGEFYALTILATIGMLLLAGTENLLLIFIGLELTSLSLYILAAYDDRSKASAEAGMKYFLFGGMSAAFLLFGMSYLYGMAGSLDLPRIAGALAAKEAQPLLEVAIIMIVIGFGFKLAAVPFHFWAPDVYQAAPVPSAMWIGSVSKIGSVYALAKILFIGLGDFAWGPGALVWGPMLVLMAVLSMVAGNVAALAQTSVRRLVAYSAVAHAGYLLVGLLGTPVDAYASVIYYVVTYALTTIGLFAVIGALQGKGPDLTLEDFRGLSKRSPLLAGSLFVFVLSLAGIPPLAGFFGKFYLFTAALLSDRNNLQLIGVVVIGILMSAVSLYYYLRLLKYAFVLEKEGAVLRIKSGFVGQSMIAILAASVVVLGCFPDLFMGRLIEAVLSVVW
ncbi:MAG: NADH-quinone oxidoreductase subunit N [Limisphaerales bacterium]